MTSINKKLISAVMNRNVRHVGVHTTAIEALGVMQAYSASSVLVLDEGLILGIITERDIVRAWHKHGQLAPFACTDLMQSPVVTVDESTRCLDAYHLMTSRGIRHLAVINSQSQVVGMVSEGDVMRNFGLEYYMSFKEVGGVMSGQFCALPPAATVGEALACMIENRQSCVVVVDDGGRPMGMLTERDIVGLCQKGSQPHQLKLSSVMHYPVMTVKPRKRLHAAARFMEEAHIRRLVVVDERGVAIGLLTHHEIASGLEGDYVRYLKDILELQQRHLKESQDAIDEKLLLSNILRSVGGTAVLASDLDFRISYATPSVAPVLGLKHEDIGGSDLRQTLTALGWGEATASLTEAARTGHSKHYVVDTEQGSTNFRISMLLNGRQDAQGYLVMAQRT
jgi:CBS domain-containing protein